MRMPWRVLSAAVIASSVAWIGGPADAAPLSAPLALKSAEAASVETVQWRRGRGGRWIGPAAGFAAGVAIGRAFAPRYDDGYGAYAYDPGYAYEGYASVPVRRGYRGFDCTGEESADSANPSWACPHSR